MAEADEASLLIYGGWAGLVLGTVACVGSAAEAECEWNVMLWR